MKSSCKRWAKDSCLPASQSKSQQRGSLGRSFPVVQRNTRRPTFTGGGPSPRYTETRGPSARAASEQAPQPQRRPARARRRCSPTNMHALAPECPTPASPARGAGQSSGVRSGSSRRGGRVPASERSSIGSRVAKPRPSQAPPTPSPARGLGAPRVARVRARAQGRALGGKASPRPRINPFRAHSLPKGPGPPGSVPARAGGAPSPPARTAHAREEGGCRRGCSRPTRQPVLVQEKGLLPPGTCTTSPSPRPLPELQKKKLIITPNIADHLPIHPPTHLPTAPRVQPGRPQPAS